LWKISDFKKDENLVLKGVYNSCIGNIVDLTIFRIDGEEGGYFFELFYIAKPTNNLAIKDINFVMAGKKLKMYSSNYKAHRYKLTDNEIEKIKSTINLNFQNHSKFAGVRLLFKYKTYYLLFLFNDREEGGFNCVLDSEFKVVQKYVEVCSRFPKLFIFEIPLIAGGIYGMIPTIAFDSDEDGTSEILGSLNGWEISRFGMFYFDMKDQFNKLHYNLVDY